MMTLHKKQNAEKFLRDMEQGIYGVSVSTSSEALERMVSSPRTVRLLKQDENGESPRTKLYKVPLPSHSTFSRPLIPKFHGICMQSRLQSWWVRCGTAIQVYLSRNDTIDVNPITCALLVSEICFFTRIGSGEV